MRTNREQVINGIAQSNSFFPVETVEAEEVVKNFFNRKYNMAYRMRMRIFGSITVKVLYIGSNLFAFLALDFLLNHQYMNYGVKWINWVQLPNEIAYDYMGELSVVCTAY